MAKNVNLKRVVRVLVIMIILLGLFYLFAPRYVIRALIYQHVGIDDYPIFENRKVRAENYHSWAFTENKTKIPAHHLKKMKKYEPVSFLIVQNDTVISEHYWDNYGPDSYSNLFSSTKSIVSLLIGIANDKGYIDSLDQAVGDYLPEYNKGNKSKISIKDLLTMSSGLSWDESYGSLFSTTTQAYYGKDLESLVMDLEVIEKPGERYKYLSGNTQILGFLLTEATGMTMADFAGKYLWTPIGARHDALWSLDKKEGIEKAYCCFNSNARDIARIGKLVLDSGQAYGKQLISKEYLLNATQPADYLVDKNGKENNFYGYQWWIVNYKGTTVKYARGILGQYIFVLPDYDAVVVRLGHLRSEKYQGHHPIDVFVYLDAAFAMLN
ncbi:MAG: beta-lactamase family protein [Bacteroidales bacterium]|nr:beta-lactamase family protein [Bacteroidales bacterium]MCF8327526.1 beta-lactamase family protein [Bacteroidales bacterium]